MFSCFSSLVKAEEDNQEIIIIYDPSLITNKAEDNKIYLNNIQDAHDVILRREKSIKMIIAVGEKGHLALKDSYKKPIVFAKNRADIDRLLRQQELQRGTLSSDKAIGLSSTLSDQKRVRQDTLTLQKQGQREDVFHRGRQETKQGLAKSAEDTQQHPSIKLLPPLTEAPRPRKIASSRPDQGNVSFKKHTPDETDKGWSKADPSSNKSFVQANENLRNAFTTLKPLLTNVGVKEEGYLSDAVIHYRHALDYHKIGKEAFEGQKEQVKEFLKKEGVRLEDIGTSREGVVKWLTAQIEHNVKEITNSIKIHHSSPKTPKKTAPAAKEFNNKIEPFTVKKIQASQALIGAVEADTERLLEVPYNFIQGTTGEKIDKHSSAYKDLMKMENVKHISEYLSAAHTLNFLKELLGEVNPGKGKESIHISQKGAEKLAVFDAEFANFFKEVSNKEQGSSLEKRYISSLFEVIAPTYYKKMNGIELTQLEKAIEPDKRGIYRSLYGVLEEFLTTTFGATLEGYREKLIPDVAYPKDRQKVYEHFFNTIILSQGKDFHTSKATYNKASGTHFEHHEYQGVKYPVRAKGHNPHKGYLEMSASPLLYTGALEKIESLQNLHLKNEMLEKLHRYYDQELVPIKNHTHVTSTLEPHPSIHYLKKTRHVEAKRQVVERHLKNLVTHISGSVKETTHDAHQHVKNLHQLVAMRNHDVTHFKTTAHHLKQAIEKAHGEKHFNDAKKQELLLLHHQMMQMHEELEREREAEERARQAFHNHLHSLKRTP